MKKLLFLFLFLVFVSFVFAEEIQCNPVQGKEKTFSAKFTVNSYCDISLDNEGKHFARIEITEGYYTNENEFYLPVNGYVVVNEAFLSAESQKEQIDCSSGWGKTLDLKSSVNVSGNTGVENVNSDSFPYSQECGVGGTFFGINEVYFSLKIQKPAMDLTNLPYKAKSVIEIKLEEDLIKKYWSKKLKQVIEDGLDQRNISDNFFVVYPKESGSLGIIEEKTIKTRINVNLNSIDYEKKIAVFKLTDIEENDKELCEITTGFNETEGKFIDCNLAKIKITGKVVNPVEQNGEVRYYFNVELKPETAEVANTAGTSNGTGSGTENGTTTVPASLSELQEQINNNILEQYKNIFSESRSEFK